MGFVSSLPSGRVLARKLQAPFISISRVRNMDVLTQDIGGKRMGDALELLMFLEKKYGGKDMEHLVKGYLP